MNMPSKQYHDANLLGDIYDFHTKFGFVFPKQPTELSKEMYNFRVKFMHEELKEYEDAIEEGNLEKQFDALIDLVYVALGTGYLHGFPFARGWDEVHAANMRKERADKNTASDRGGTNDIIKPEGWQPPDLSKFVPFYPLLSEDRLPIVKCDFASGNQIEDNAKPITSDCPDYSSIPISALKSLAARFSLGEKKYGRNSWRKRIQELGAPYIIERLNHVIHHSKKLQAKLEGHLEWDKDDDVGGILWGGAAAAEAMVVLEYNKHVDPEAVVE